MGENNKIRKDIPLALYYQLKEELRRKILAGEWIEGSKIPSEAEICEMFDVSRITVRKAIEELQDENYLVKKQGKGTFVQSRSIGQKLHKFYSFSEELKQIGIEETAKIVNFDIIVPDASIRNALQLGVDEQVYWIKRVRFMDIKAYTVENSYIPIKLVPGLRSELVQSNGLYSTLKMFGIYVDHATETFGAVLISKEDAKHMEITSNEAGISLSRITYNGSVIVEYCKSVVRGDVFHYTVELR